MQLDFCSVLEALQSQNMRLLRSARNDMEEERCQRFTHLYRADHPKLDDADWHVFTASQYDAKTGEWHMSKLPVHHIID